MYAGARAGPVGRGHMHIAYAWPGDRDPDVGGVRTKTPREFPYVISPENGAAEFSLKATFSSVASNHANVVKLLI